MNVNKKVTHRHGHFRSEFRIVYLLNLLGQFIQKVITKVGNVNNFTFELLLHGSFYFSLGRLKRFLDITLKKSASGRYICNG